MRRWLTALTSAAVVAAPLAAQVNTQKPGYVVVRVKMNSDGGGTGTAPGGSELGEGAGPGRFGGGSPGGPQGGGGYGGGIQGGPQGGPAQPGGLAPGGIGGGLGVPGFPGIPGGLGSGAPAATATERSVHILVPYSRLSLHEKLYPQKGTNAERNPEYAAIRHQFGSSILFPNKANLQIEFLPFTTEEQRLKDAFSRWNLDSNRKPAVLLAYIGDALKSELVELAEQFSDSLVKQFEKEKELPADVAAYIKGYNELKAKWNEPAPNNPAADTWKAKFGPEANVHTDAPHYAVIHFSGDSLSGQAGEAASYAADLLEKNLKSFYLWHLREGFALPLPDKRLVVVVTKNGSQLPKLREGLDGLAVSSDSFYAPAHNLVVISPERTDDLGRSFNAIAATKLEGFDRNDLLKGKYPALKPQQSPDELALASTYAMVRRALEDEALRSAITREGSRQLFVTLGIVPQHVRLPKWVESGIGSVLQHPRGGGVVEVSAKDGPGIVVGVNTGHGAANYELLYQFLRFYPAKKDGRDNKSIDAPAVLTNVLTDKYFAAVASGIDLDRPASITDLLPIRPGSPGSGGGGIAPPPGEGGPATPPALPQPPGGVPSGPGRGGSGTDAQGPGGSPLQPPPAPGGPGAPGLPGGQGPGTLPGGDGGDGIIDNNTTNPLLTAAQLDQKAKATAWALVFYLTKNGKLSKLHAYLEKLGELPRDMRVDRDVSMKLFCETFGLLKPNSQEVDKGAFNTFAKDWMAFMHQQSPTYQTLTLKKLNGDTGGNNPSGPGGIPGIPGGSPGSPGGGPGLPGGGPGGRPGGPGGGPGGRPGGPGGG